MSLGDTALQNQSIADFFNNSLEYYEKEKLKVEKSYDSLISFRRIVERSQGSFTDTISTKKRILDDISGIKNCRTGTKYSEGMRDELSNHNKEFVDQAYVKLFDRIDSKLKSYRRELEDLEKIISKKKN